jgi:hypothetical protein
MNSEERRIKSEELRVKSVGMHCFAMLLLRVVGYIGKEQVS